MAPLTTTPATACLPDPSAKAHAPRGPPGASRPQAQPARPPPPVELRRLFPLERWRVAAHLQTLDLDDRYLRFGAHVAGEMIDTYVQRIDFGASAVFGAFSPETALVGVAHAAADSTGVVEVGLSVLASCRGQGVGGLLLQRSIDWAHQARAREIVMHCRAENRPVLRLARRHGMQRSCENGECLVRLQLPGATEGPGDDAPLLRPRSARLARLRRALRLT